jgi:integrase
MSIRQDTRTGKWYYRFWRGRSHFKGGFRTRDQAKQAEIRRQNQTLDDGPRMSGPARELTLTEAGELFFENHSHRCKRSWRNDRARIVLIGRFFKNTLMKDVTPELLEEFLDRMQKQRGVADLTRNHYLGLVKAIYNRLKKWRLYRGENPAFYVEMKKVPRARVRFLYPAEEQLLTPVVAQDAIVWPYYVVALHTGMRLGEIARMKAEDISLSIRDIFVPDSKSGRSRHVPVSEELAVFLERQIAGKKPEEHALAGVIRDYVSRRFRWLCVRSSIADLKFHDLRHTFAARLLTKGVPIYKVSKILGHSSVVVTEQHYGHLSLADLKGAISCIDGVVSVPFAADLQRDVVKPAESRVLQLQNASINRLEGGFYGGVA